MVNERITEDFFRDSIKKDELYKKSKIILEEQSSKNIKIDKLLKNASKSGIGGGRPEFVIQFKENSDLIIIVECKPNIRFHKSKEGNKYKDYAVDGVLLYSSFLSKEYDVLSIAISGETKTNLRISHFLQLKGTKEAHKIFEEDRLLSLNDYLNGYKTDEKKFNQDYQELLKYSKTLNDELHSIKIPESQRSLLISGILIALTDKAFCSAYKFQKPKELSENLINTIKNKLTDVENEHITEIITTYSFIKTHTIISKEENKLRDIITEIDEKINNFMKTYKYYDVLGQFYIEFLRYANNDKGLGIVLTPPHITELFSEIANVNKDSVVLDNCAGTGGFLISAMRKMIKDAKGDSKKEEKIKLQQIIGIEFQHDIFALICSNMFIHGDGRSNLVKGSCFDEKIMRQVRNFKPNVGFLNPPYKSTKTDPEELEFVLNNLSLLQKGSICVAIVPMSCALAKSGVIFSLKEKILREHTLEAVFSMPKELFHNSDVGVNTCIMVFKAKEKHPANYKTYFGYWKDDGFIKRRQGREDYNNKWTEIKKYWITTYRNKEEIIGHSIKKVVSAEDEWCVEAYMETNYSSLVKEDFEKTLKECIVYSLKSGLITNVLEKSITNTFLNLNTKDWKFFKIVDLFDIKKGERLVKEERIEGNIPLITATSENNGVVNYISYDEFKDTKKLFKDKLTIDMFFNVFYHNYKYFSDDNVHTLIPKNISLNKYACLFLATILKKLQYKYDFGRQVRLQRLDFDKIRIPIDKKGNPDWQFMENYIKSLSYSSNL
ncbi:methyltransferase [Candidatus Woesearchaeota archaeon CG_4_10_14_0_2_um_filter_33_10]|nr:MAG: methyltransferase [Candidatus Woesearchaeota archaeon CG06_land_8_20_14_3_00_33_13]PIZ53260.1 MAG: methyltransferase [Candidatus Woesearchaeota archaeon CG_4_10_14_0_2_um_filter_33_10]